VPTEAAAAEQGGGGGGGGRGGGGHAAQVAAGILVTRVLGYVRERVFAYYFGNSSVPSPRPSLRGSMRRAAR